MIAIAVASLAGALPSQGAAQVLTLDQLLARFRAVQGMECQFREEKRIALLSTPIVSEGALHYARPGRLVRRITRPAPQIVLIDGGRLQMSEGGRVETIDLDAQPVVRSFVDTFTLLFGGDRAALERLYRVEHVGGGPAGPGWMISLTPRSAPLDRFLREIRFDGDGTQLRSMVMVEVSGDVTTTTFTDVNTSRRYRPDEQARIFSLQ